MPLSLKEANVFVELNHRHHKPVVGHKFSIGVSDGERIRGVAIVGRPVSRHLDNGMTLEVTRCCTDGVINGCSMLYGAAKRAALALGYKRLITYTLAEEGGGSLRGAGWKATRLAGGGSWDRASRPRVNDHPECQKMLWDAWQLPPSRSALSNITMNMTHD